MNDALTLITSLGKEGKNPTEIARELHARGVTDRRGKWISPAVVEGLLRFAELSPPTAAADMTGAVWGKSATPARVNEVDHDTPEPVKKRKNRWNPHNHLSEELKAKITRMYHNDCKSMSEIATELGLDYRRIHGFCTLLAGFSMPPGEVTVYVENGQRITRYPAGYARNAAPQRNVRPTQGGW